MSNRKMVENWIDVAGYEGHYQVSNLGGVRSMERTVVYSDGRTYRYPQKQLAPIFRGRYKGVALSSNSKVKQFDIHRLVATAFCKGNGAAVNHIDRDTHNNIWTNLEWCTYRHNVRHSCAKIKPRDVAFLRCIKLEHVPIVAAQLGIRKRSAQSIHHGVNWPDINPPAR